MSRALELYATALRWNRKSPRCGLVAAADEEKCKQAYASLDREFGNASNRAQMRANAQALGRGAAGPRQIGRVGPTARSTSAKPVLQLRRTVKNVKSHIFKRKPEEERWGSGFFTSPRANAKSIEAFGNPEAHLRRARRAAIGLKSFGSAAPVHAFTRGDQIPGGAHPELRQLPVKDHQRLLNTERVL